MFKRRELMTPKTIGTTDEAYAYKKTALDNGLTVVTVSMPHLHAATISVFVRVGSRHETQQTNGLSHLLEHMLFRGCDEYPDSTALNTAMEDLGGTLDGFTMRELSSYHCTVHPAYAKEATEILGAMFRSPRFSDLEIERSIILEEILDALDERGRMIDLDALAHREAFRGHPLGQSIDGPRRNLKRFCVGDLRMHHQRFYGAQNMVLCFSGKIDEKVALEAARRGFSGLISGRRAKETPPQALRDAPRFLYVRSDDPQTRLRLSFRAVPETHKDYPALVLIRRILDGGLSARLPVELVEKRGIVYDVGTELETYADVGLFDFELAVANRKLAYAVSELFGVILKIRNERVLAEELERVRRRVRISLEFVLDSSQELGHWFGATELFRTPLAPEARIRELERVTQDDLHRVAKKIFDPKRLTVAAVGNATQAEIRATRRALEAFSMAAS